MDDTLQQALRAHQAGNFAAASQGYKAVLEKQPGQPEALHLLGLIHLQQGDPETARELITKAVKRKPGAALFHNHLGLALRGLGDLAGARKAFARALSLESRLYEAANNLGLVLNELGLRDEACKTFEKALAAKPDFTAALANLGALERRRGNIARAEQLLGQACRADPGHTAAAINLALVYKTQERFDEAEQILRDLLVREPQHPEANVNLAFLLLAQGKYRAAAPHFELRMDKQILGQALSSEFPLWQGEDLSGKTLLLHAEQGLGDTLQFMRFVPQLADMGIKPLVVAQAALCPLLARTPGVAGVCAMEASGAMGAEAWVPLMSLLDRLKLEGPSPPARIPYLLPDPDKLRAWQDRLGDCLGSGLKVGLTWAGNPDHSNDAARSLKLKDLAPLFAGAEASFVALQFDGAQAAIKPSGLSLQNFADEIKDFDDSAALIAALDLVITIDSAPLHLAAGLGVETWALIARPADWRWGLEGTTSPWYPSLKLFRQTRPGDWSSVIEQVASTLQDRIKTA